MKKAIVFGVTGQDGSHLADLLLDKQYKVIGVNRRASTDNTERISHILDHERFELVQADITDAHSVYQVLKDNDDVDEVYNLAAQSHVGVSFKQPALTWDITGKGCLNILQSIVELGLFGCRFYQASSSEMFGASYDINRDQVKYQNEETKFLPQSPYAIAKCASHYMTRLCREGYGIHASAGILFNHEGPRRGETFVTRKIVSALCKIKMGFQKKLYLGNLEAKRDWGHAKDYVEAMWKMLQKKNPSDYVISTGKQYTVKQFVNLTLKELRIKYLWKGKGINSKCYDAHGNCIISCDEEYYRPLEVDTLLGNSNKARRELKWKPKISLKNLIKEMVNSELLKLSND